MQPAATRLGLTGVAVAGIAALAVVPAAQGEPANSEAGAGAVRAWTVDYHDVDAAVADGFLPTEECVPGMGYHFVNPDRFDTVLKPSEPEALLYTRDEDGEWVLIGAEWLVVDADQDLSTNDDRPSIFGRPLDGPMPGHGPGMPSHYDRHAYVWTENPDGTFAMWNPEVTCP